MTERKNELKKKVANKPTQKAGTDGVCSCSEHHNTKAYREFQNLCCNSPACPRTFSCGAHTQHRARARLAHITSENSFENAEPCSSGRTDRKGEQWTGHKRDRLATSQGHERAHNRVVYSAAVDHRMHPLTDPCHLSKCHVPLSLSSHTITEGKTHSCHQNTSWQLSYQRFSYSAALIRHKNRRSHRARVETSGRTGSGGGTQRELAGGVWTVQRADVSLRRRFSAKKSKGSTTSESRKRRGVGSCRCGRCNANHSESVGMAYQGWCPAGCPLLGRTPPRCPQDVNYRVKGRTIV